MEALNFLKFWRPTNTYPFITNGAPHPLNEKEDELEKEEEEDSFFDLELTVFDFDSKKDKSNDNPEANNVKDNKTRLDTKEHHNNSAKKAALNFSETALSLSPNDPISRRKILPIEPTSKPQSPIALLKSAPRFQVLMFKKPKSKSMATAKRESKTVSMDNQEQRRQESKAFFTVKLKVEEAPKNSLFTRGNSLRKTESKIQDSQPSEDSKAERFSKEVIQKYLNLIKPLYVKVSKRYSEKIKFSEELSVASTASSPSTVALPKKKKPLRKSKSASASIAAAQPVNRRDDSLLQQDDGIQSAILHCKRSFNSSRDSSFLTSSISDSLHDKSRNSYSRDSSLMSRFASEPSEEISVKTCIEEGNVVGI
ncbi:membrane-associated kinase regulator 5 [Corylus avellana]|uniref:membrane-associated kinase regulator 5 n=1 Tax=Corylus avellana TaxID=13451 RepID=UPI001E235327|nr:membrane-associated kinase regulator 5 [Corylus avellana]